MTLVTMEKMLKDARRDKYALGGFVFWSLESVKAIIEAAEDRGWPAIIQTAPILLDFMGYKNVKALALELAKNTDIPVALHLDHATSLEEIRKALDHGFTSVMMDASTKSFEENVELTTKTVEIAKKYGATVEAELGHVGGAEFDIESVSEGEKFQTDPQWARKFVEQTGVDCLAVAIGTVHGIYKYVPELNFERLMLIEKLVDIPLVLHGGSGTPIEDIQKTINHGIAKINICTDVLSEMAASYMMILKQEDFSMKIMDLIVPPYDAMKKAIGLKMDQFHIEKEV